MEIWNIIVKTNTFNFLIFVLLFAWIFKIAKVGTLLTNMQNKVAKFIDDSEDSKKDSEEKLKEAEKTVAGVSVEINDILSSADLKAIRLGRKMTADANVMSETILKNADKVNDAKGEKIISELSQQTAEASIELAKKHIINVLERKPQYHIKFLNDSIEEIDRFSFYE